MLLLLLMLVMVAHSASKRGAVQLRTPSTFHTSLPPGLPRYCPFGRGGGRVFRPNAAGPRWRPVWCDEKGDCAGGGLSCASSDAPRRPGQTHAAWSRVGKPARHVRLFLGEEQNEYERIS